LALGAHQEGLVATIAKLKLALCAGEMHATATSEIVSEFAFWTIDTVQLQVPFDALILNVRIIGFLPL